MPFPIHHDNGLVSLDHDTDACQDPDTGRWYLRQYQHESPHNTRESESFDSLAEAHTRFGSGGLCWDEWE